MRLRHSHASTDKPGRLVAHHFGPDAAEVGGMASVLHSIQALGLGADAVYLHATWSAKGLKRTLPATIKAAFTIVRLPSTEVAHFHLSERGSFVREGGLLMLARARGLSTVVTLHGADFEAFVQGHPRISGAVLRAANVILCLSPAVVGLLPRLAPSSIVEYVSNPVDVDVDSPDVATTSEVVLFAGEIGRRKGADLLFEAWPRVRSAVPSASLIVVGPRTELPVPQHAGMDVLDALPSDEVRRLMHRARCVALPSRAEAMPMVLLEAMAAGRPFVATPVGGISALADGGLLVPVDDSEALANALISLLQDPALAARLGRHGRDNCERLRSSAVLDTRLRTVYSQALITRGIRSSSGEE
jgi:glycosyltransferase involved in cell wall biosynthesis